VDRVSKYLLFQMSSGDTFLAHQRFTGWFRLPNDPLRDVRVHALNKSQEEPHVRVRWHFEDGTDLVYIDPRCLAVLKVFEGEDQFDISELKGMAPDVLKPNIETTLITERPPKIPIEYFLGKLEKFKNKDIKSVLLDQRGIVSGIGNYLACEICFSARTDPWTKCKDLPSAHIYRIYDMMYQIPKLSLESNSYSWFHVFRLKECRVCGSTITRRVHKPGKKNPTKGQATYYCTKCQGVDESRFE